MSLQYFLLCTKQKTHLFTITIAGKFSKLSQFYPAVVVCDVNTFKFPLQATENIGSTAFWFTQGTF